MQYNLQPDLAGATAVQEARQRGALGNLSLLAEGMGSVADMFREKRERKNEIDKLFGRGEYAGIDDVLAERAAKMAVAERKGLFEHEKEMAGTAFDERKKLLSLQQEHDERMERLRTELGDDFTREDAKAQRLFGAGSPEYEVFKERSKQLFLDRLNTEREKGLAALKEMQHRVGVLDYEEKTRLPAEEAIGAQRAAIARESSKDIRESETHEAAMREAEQRRTASDLALLSQKKTLARQPLRERYEEQMMAKEIERADLEIQKIKTEIKNADALPIIKRKEKRDELLMMIEKNRVNRTRGVLQPLIEREAALRKELESLDSRKDAARIASIQASIEEIEKRFDKENEKLEESEQTLLGEVMKTFGEEGGEPSGGKPKRGVDDFN